MKYALILSIIFLTGVALAQSVDTVIVTTDKTSVDLLVAKAAGDRQGIPVFTLPGGELNEDVKSSIGSAGARTVVIVGGPVVVSVQAESSLKTLGYNVIRLWGIERTGTAVEVAKYFWAEGSRCAVLADDTKNPEADTQDGILASTLASNLECPFLPVPKGEVPSEVLALLENMNVSDVHHIGVLPSGLKAMLAKYKLKELRDTDVDKEVLDYYSNNTKVVIIAARAWNDVAVASSNPAAGSIVRFVTDASQTEAIADFIIENSIKDVRIVGIPALAGEIEIELRAKGIVPTKVVGERASEVVKNVWEAHKERWEERREKYIEIRNSVKERIKSKLLERLNETESEIDEEMIEADDLAANGDVTALKAKLNDAKAKLLAIKQDIIAGDIAIAERKMQEIRDYRKEKWQSRDRIKWEWQKHADMEERGAPNLRGMYESTLNEVEGVLPRLREKCNSTDVENLVEEAKSLRDSIKTALDANDHPKAAPLLKQQREVVSNAKRLANICERSEKLPEIAKRAAERNVERAMKTRGKVEGKLEKIVERVQERAAEAKVFTIEGDDAVLSPSTIEVGKGEKVRIKFKVRNERVSFGGLDFRSDYFSTNKIAPGSSGEVEFTADKSFTFISYWPGSNVVKARGQVVVK
ncbi:MAG: cupredoxin domain-containing protein [Candidatus Aenigmarchaeota archaeon]|nr:cupredoxin domain-containing protein [Candidatus Aenigmarchaeota archaeon]